MILSIPSSGPREGRRRRALAIVTQGLEARTRWRALIACTLALATAFFMLECCVGEEVAKAKALAYVMREERRSAWVRIVLM